MLSDIYHKIYEGMKMEVGMTYAHIRGGSSGRGRQIQYMFHCFSVPASKLHQLFRRLAINRYFVL